MLIRIAVVIILILLIIFVITGKQNEQMTNHKPSIYRFGDFYDPDRFTVAMIGGVHGNEPSGAVALIELMDSGWFERESSDRLNFIIIPKANEHGLREGIRGTGDILHSDLNRSFHERHLSNLSKYLLDAIESADLVLDFHEGWGWHRINNSSIGSTISPTSTHVLPVDIANAIVDELNKDIQDPSKKFLMIPDISCDIKSSLSCYMERNKRNYILMETTGQKDIQPLEIRVNQVKKAVYVTVRILKMV